MSIQGLLWKLPLGLGLVWIFVSIYQSVTALPPGRVVEDQGRAHVSKSEVEKTVYKSDPPVSGPHLVTWVKPGIYTEEQNKGELIHSLEHGYVVIHYSCDPKQIDQKLATGSAMNSTEECAALMKKLSDLAQMKKLFKLIVVPNHTITTKIVLTAWDHIDELNEYDEKRIISFIDYYRDHGPEQTME